MKGGKGGNGSRVSNETPIMTGTAQYNNPSGGLLNWFLSKLYYHAIICRITYSAHRNVCVCVHMRGICNLPLKGFSTAHVFKVSKGKGCRTLTGVSRFATMCFCHNSFVHLLTEFEVKWMCKSRKSHFQNVPNFRIGLRLSTLADIGRQHWKWASNWWPEFVCWKCELVVFKL